MQPRYKGVFASSTDPTGQTPSLTVSSGVQMVIGLITTIAIVKGVDPAIANSNAQSVSQAVQNIIAQYLALLPALYAAYHSMQFLFGFARKFYPRVPALPDLPQQAAVPQPATN